MVEAARQIVKSSQWNTRRIWWSLVAIIGYILSPLSPWNDMYVNVPLAYFFAIILNMLIGMNKLAGFYIGYTITNIVGLLMLALGVHSIQRRASPRRQILKYIIASMFYAVIASILLSFLGLL